jgi:threonine dehydrogenase-like Zn-dependent dehydrogenase
VSDLPSTMPAAVYREPGRIELEERAVPDLGPDQVLVEVGHCGICGSDIHLMHEGWGQKNIVEGHEWSGVIAALGPDVEEWEVGDQVVGGPSPKCGHCRRCLEGKPSQCYNRRGSAGEAFDGAFARYVRANAISIHRVPPGLSLREAALTEPLAVALHGITRSGAGPEDAIMVFGAGPIGALTLAALKAKSLGPVTVVEPGERRRQLARDLGADKVVEPADLETFPPWQPERLADEPADVVLECSGKKAAMEAGFHQLNRGGQLVFVGAGMEPPTFDPNRMLLNELHVCGSFVYDLGGFDRALELLASGAMPTDRLLEPVDIPLEGLSEALRCLYEGELPGKALVAPSLSVTSA